MCDGKITKLKLYKFINKIYKKLKVRKFVIKNEKYNEIVKREI